MKIEKVNVTKEFGMLVKKKRDLKPFSSFLRGFVPGHGEDNQRNRSILERVLNELPDYMFPMACELRDFCWTHRVYLTDFWIANGSVNWESDPRNKMSFFYGRQKVIHLMACVPDGTFRYAHAHNGRIQSVTVHSGHARLCSSTDSEREYTITFIGDDLKYYHGVVDDFNDGALKLTLEASMSSGTNMDLVLEWTGKTSETLIQNVPLVVLHVFCP